MPKASASDCTMTIKLTMNIKPNTSIFLLMVIGVVMISCSGDDGAGTKDLLKGRLYKTWTISEAGYVRYNGVDVTDQYTTLQYTFSADGTYRKTVNGDESAGTWMAADNTLTTLILDSGIPLYVLELTETAFRFSLIIDEENFNGGRKRGLSGEYEFYLQRGR
jgi:hypothetical protein